MSLLPEARGLQAFAEPQGWWGQVLSSFGEWGWETSHGPLFLLSAPQGCHVAGPSQLSGLGKGLVGPSATAETQSRGGIGTRRPARPPRMFWAGDRLTWRSAW